MKVSLNTIKQYTDVDLPVDELVAKINAQLGGVEQVINVGARYKDARIVRVVACDDHPNADRLHVCKIDDGGVVEGVARDEQGLVQVVCGAPNVDEAMWVVWLPPGATVPSTHEDKEPFILDARELRGVMSNGMLASPKELGLGDSHEGILELDEAEWRPGEAVLAPGASFAEVYGLDDTVIEIENKMFTHRPDCFGQLGVAREIAGIQGKQFTSPAWYKDFPSFNSGDGLELAVKNDALEKVPRFMAVAIEGVTIQSSPVWLQAELVRLGSKPINNVVDVTNYVMLLTGQPLHAYDYDKLRGNTLGARFAAESETVTLLNGKTYTLTPDDIVIVDAEGPVGLGGVMGGGDSEVSDTTRNIVLECATFDMYAVRKTSMRHGLFTDAVTRFNKGQSPYQNDFVLSVALKAINDTAGGKVASAVHDVKAMPQLTPVDVAPAFINDRLGLQLSGEEIAALLQNVEFGVEQDEELRITPPYWRTDIEIAEDIVEEVGRLYGFDKLPRVLPRRSTQPAPLNREIETKRRIRQSLARAGANEVLTYSFVHENVMRRAEQDSAHAFRLSNALSPDLQYYRLSVLPSLLDRVHANVKAGYDQFVLFEIGKGHHKDPQSNDEDGLPREPQFVDMVFTAKKPLSGAAFYRMRRYVEQLLVDLDLEGMLTKPLPEELDTDVYAPFDRSRAATIETLDGVIVGVVGELKASVRKNFKLPEYTAAATINFDALHAATDSTQSRYVPLPRFPKVSQDISLKVAGDVAYASLFETVTAAMKGTGVSGSGIIKVSPKTIYQPDGGNLKTITYHIEVSSFERTLTDAEVTKLLEGAAQAAHDQLGAERV